MQPDSPYQVIKPLGSSQLGTVWAAVDDEGRELTVAVLEAHVAGDHRWREAFTAAANALPPQKDGRRYVSADFATAAPWVIRLVDGGPGAEQVLLALGAEYQPMAQEVPAAAQAGVSAAASGPLSTAVPPAASEDQSPADPFASPVRRIEPSPPQPRHTGRWVMVTVLAVVVLTVAGTQFVLAQGNGPTPGGSTQARTTTAAAPVPTPSPLHPGLEPPRVGDWPTKWPKFTARDKTQKVPLDGVSFALTMPTGWSCTPAASGEGFVKYDCGMSAGAEQLGGELIVRTCPQSCDTARQDTMRKVEEAWGQQWRYAGKNVTLAETLKIDGTSRYGLVLVAYFRDGAQEPINRQLVLRMTSPVQWLDDLRKVANGARSAAKF